MPPPYIAVPAVEALRYTAEEPALCEMYLHLLATAMDSRTVPLAHPAFAEIIRQLTPDEARIINLFAQFNSLPVVWIQTGTCSVRFRRLPIRLPNRNDTVCLDAIATILIEQDVTVVNPAPVVYATDIS